jgi:hypothetical protein
VKVALITGGSKGIGYGIAEAMLRQQYNVAVTGRDESTLSKAVGQLKKIGRGEIVGMICDVRDYAAQQKVVQQVLDKWKSLDVLIANAGVGHFSPIDEMTLDQWKETIDINLTGVFYSIKASIEALKKSKGYIITISSLAGTNFFATAAAYNASKFGLTGFTQAAMLDLRRFGIKVSTIMPGSVATDFAGPNSKDNESWKIQIEDIGQIVTDLLNLNPRTLPSKIEVRPSLPAK